MRLFIAIDLPLEAKNSLDSLKPELSKIRARLVPKDNYHVTLKFLGEVEDEFVPRIISSLQEIKFQPFRVSLEAAGAFPGEHIANSIWVSAGPAEHLMRVKELVDRALPRFRDEHAFKAHITLARLESEDVRDVLARINQRLEKKEILVSRVTLYKSTLTPKGPVYEKLL